MCRRGYSLGARTAARFPKPGHVSHILIDHVSKPKTKQKNVHCIFAKNLEILGEKQKNIRTADKFQVLHLSMGDLIMNS